MKRITIVSENNGWWSNTYIDDEEATKFLKKYIEKQGIESNPDINNEHKLLLDISRANNLIIKDDDGHKNVYICENITNDQYDAFTNLSHGYIVNVYDWYDSTKEFNGYHIIEGNEIEKSEKLFIRTKDLVYKKLMNTEKQSKRRSTK